MLNLMTNPHYSSAADVTAKPEDRTKRINQPAKASGETQKIGSRVIYLSWRH